MGAAVYLTRFKLDSARTNLIHKHTQKSFLSPRWMWRREFYHSNNDGEIDDKQGVNASGFDPLTDCCVRFGRWWTHVAETPPDELFIGCQFFFPKRPTHRCFSGTSSIGRGNRW